MLTMKNHLQKSEVPLSAQLSDHFQTYLLRIIRQILYVQTAR